MSRARWTQLVALGIATFAGSYPAVAQRPAASSDADALRRRALVGIGVIRDDPSSSGVRVTRVTPTGTGAALGLRDGDVLLRLDTTGMTSVIAFEKVIRSWRAGQRVSALVRRGGNVVTLNAAAVRYPEERVDGLQIRYGSAVTAYGDRVRTIVSRPATMTGRRPAILLVPWLSCGSVEMSITGNPSGTREVIFGLSLAGYEVWRVDKPGLGDSEGPDCSEVDYHREVAAYRAAYAELWRSPSVDTTAIVIFGESLGGSIAPQIALARQPRGIIVQGTYARSWFEHIIDFERRRLTLSGSSPAEVSAAVPLLAELYSGYLLEKQTPGEVIRRKPHLASVWYDDPAHQFGRPAAFYHQVQDAKVAAAWEQITVPTLIVHGEYDWIMAREDHDLIAEIMNRRQAGRARVVSIRGLDHDMLRFPSAQAAFDGTGGVVAPEVLSAMIEWLRGLLSSG
jgi:pimeloyl-ACP methyl ester carboxylesterase